MQGKTGIGLRAPWLALLGALLLGSWRLAAASTDVWVTGGGRYNLRSGPGVDYKAVDVVKSGEAVTLLSDNGGWTKVRMASGAEGWIDSEHIVKDPPPGAKVVLLEAEVANLRAQLAAEKQAAERARTEREASRKEAAQARAEAESRVAEVEAATEQSRRLDWLTGAGIVVFGMLTGAILHWSSARRTPARLRF